MTLLPIPEGVTVTADHCTQLAWSKTFVESRVRHVASPRQHIGRSFCLRLRGLFPPSPTLTSSATTRASIESAAKRGRKVFRHPSVRPSALQIGNLRGVRALEWGEIPCFFRLMGTQADRQCMPRRPRQSPWHADAVASEALL